MAPRFLSPLPVLGLITLSACELGDAGSLRDAAQVDGDAGALGPDAYRECEQWGPIGLPWAEGVFAARSYGFRREEPYLLGVPDALEGISPGGERIPCSTKLERYYCANEGGLVTIAASLGKQRWSFEARCPYYEDGVQLNLDDAPPCVDPQTVVVEGELIGVDSARATPNVTLEGPWQHFKTSSDPRLDPDEAGHGHVPAITCHVQGERYTCTSLGFRTTVAHAVVAGGVHHAISLAVEGPSTSGRCRTQTAKLDITCPNSPRGFYVQVGDGEPLRRGSGHIVKVSYEGGSPTQCVPDPDPAYAGSRNEIYLCPAAGGDEWGRGRYDVVADDDYAGSVTDPFDGCGGAGAPLKLARRGATE